MAEHELNKIVDDEGEVFNLRDSTKQPVADRVTSWGSTPSDTKYPSEKLVKTSLDAKATDSDVVHKTGTETVSGAKTFNNTSSVFSGKCASDINGAQLSSAYGVFRTELGNPTLEERGIIEETFANQLERLPKANVVYETSPKGTETWTTLAVSDSTHNLLWGGNVKGLLGISKTVDFRITINAPFYCYLNFLYFYATGNGATFHIKLERKLNSSGAWSVVSDTAEASLGWPGNNTIRHSNLAFNPTTPSQYGQVRLTLYIVSTGNVESFPTYHIDKFRYYGGYPYKADPWIEKNGSSGVTNFPKGITSGVAIPISSGGTGATTAIGAEYNILNQVADIDTTINGDRKIALCNQTKSASKGVFRWLKLSNVWTWIKGLLSSESGVNISGNAATATTAAGYTSDGAIATALDGKATTSHTHGNIANDGTDGLATHDTTKFLRGDGTWSVPPVTEQVQSDWNQATTTADDYIKNKPQNLVQDASYVHTDNNYTTEDKGKVASAVQPGDLGTAAYKDVPESGDASTTQVVMGSDSRLTRSVWSGGGTVVCGYKICTTSQIAGKSGQTSNIYAIVMGSMCLTNKYAAQPQGSDSSGVDGALAMGSFMIWCEGKPDGTITARARLFSSDAALNNADIALCKKNVNGAVEWFVAFGPWGSSKAVTASRAFGMSVCFDYVQNVNIPDTLEAVPSGYGYEDYYQLWKHPYLQSTNQGAGSSTRPVYITANGEVKECNEMLLKSGDNATSGCANALLSALPEWTTTPSDEVELIRRDTGGAASFGRVAFLTVWNYILSKFPSLGWTGSSAKTLSEDVYNYLIGASITFSVNVTSMRESTPYRVYVNWHGNILTIKNTSGSTISMGVGTVGTVSVANNNTYALPDLAPTTWTFIYDGSTLYAVPSSSVKYSLTESSSILAARATGDGSGNTISSTYAKKAVEGVSNGSYGANIGYIAPTALCVIGESHTASSYSVEDIISKTLSASYRNNNGRVYVILNTKSSNVTLTGFVSGTWSLVAGRHTTVVRWNGAYYRQD